MNFNPAVTTATTATTATTLPAQQQLQLDSEGKNSAMARQNCRHKNTNNNNKIGWSNNIAALTTRTDNNNWQASNMSNMKTSKSYGKRATCSTTNHPLAMHHPLKQQQQPTATTILLLSLLLLVLLAYGKHFLVQQQLGRLQFSSTITNRIRC